MLNEGGLVVVTHKTIEPFSIWNIPGIAQSKGYTLQATYKFDVDQYPGYLNRRGAGKQGGKRFPCEDAVTYVFKIKE